jgi:glycosyltransferase involved in cell wall biosynthesis
MKIGIDAHMLGHHETGNETYILELVKAATALGTTDQFVIYVEAGDALPNQVRQRPNVRIVKLDSRSPVRRLLLELPRRARRDRLDVLHVTYSAPLWNPCPLVVTVHDISFEKFPEYFSARDLAVLKGLVPRSVRAARRVITDTEFTKRELLDVYRLPPEKVVVTPYASGEQFRPIREPARLAGIRARYKTSEHFILAVGNLQPRKNLGRLIEAYVQAKGKYGLKHKLVIVGQSQFRSSEVQAKVQEHGLGGEVIFTGFVADEDLPLLYNAADVFVFPSLYEGFGLPVLEAMACGTPVICSNTPPLPEIADGAARLVDPRSTSDVAEALAELLCDEERRAGLRARGLQRAQEYSWERTAQQTLALYTEVAALKRMG